MPAAVTNLGVQTIQNRIGEVLLELGNRVDLNTGAPPRIALWLRNAYINLCQSYEFEGLEYTVTPQMSSSGQMAWPVGARAIKSMTITDPSGSVTYPDQKDIQTVRRMGAAKTPGIASVYCIFGTNILFAPAFDQGPYTLTLDLWARASFTADVVSTPLLLPDDWFEALDYLAIMRGHAMLGETDKAMAIQRLMYGYTDPSSGQHVPGMLYNLQLRQQANAPARDYGLQLRSNRVKY